MLEYIWFAIFITASIWCAWMDSISEGKDNYMGGYLLCSFIASLLAVYILWDHTGKILLDFLMTSLPQAGSNIHVVSAYVATGITCFAFVFGMPIIINLAFDKLKSSGDDKAKALLNVLKWNTNHPTGTTVTYLKSSLEGKIVTQTKAAAYVLGNEAVVDLEHIGTATLKKIELITG